MVTPNIGDLAATTIENYSGTFADNVTTHNPLLNEVFMRGNKTPAAGGTKIRQELMYAENSTFQWFTGLETLDVSGSEVLDAADFDWKEANANVVFSGLDEAKNSSDEAIHNLIKSRIKVAEITAKNQVAASLYSDGTGSSGKELGGLQLLIADDPTSGTVGGIDRSAQSWWRNQTFDFSSELAAASASNIQEGMNTLWRRCERNSDQPDVIVMDDVYFGFYETSLQTIQRITTSDTGNAGFTSLMYKGKKVYYDSNCPASHLYMINLDYLFYRPHPKFDFSMDKENRAINQHATVIPLFFKGALTLSNSSLQGVAKE
jgi:hypothetical protein